MNMKILAMHVDDRFLNIKTDKKTIRLESVPLCCAKHWFDSNENLSDYIGAEYYGWELTEAKKLNSERSRYSHEVCFLNVKTSKGVCDFQAHNENNGYYCGFSIEETEF